MAPCKLEIKKVMVEHFRRCDADYGERINKKLGLPAFPKLEMNLEKQRIDDLNRMTKDDFLRT